MSAIGAREILVAFNVCLGTEDISQARDIAIAIRESGGTARSKNGEVSRDDHGNPVMREGTLKACRAIGWWMPAYHCAQVSMNLDNYHLTPPHVALEEVRRQARARKLEVTGSELIGMVPLAAILMAGRHYTAKSDLAQDCPEEELVNRAVEGMQLSVVKKFQPEKDILEYRLREEGGAWASCAQEMLAAQPPVHHGIG